LYLLTGSLFAVVGVHALNTAPMLHLAADGAPLGASAGVAVAAALLLAVAWRAGLVRSARPYRGRSAPMAPAYASGGRPRPVAQDGEEPLPGPHVLAVALGHDARHLRQVTEVVDDPGGEELAQRDGAELRVPGGGVQGRLVEAPGGELSQALAPGGGELVEEALQRSPRVEPPVGVAVEGREGGAGVAGADHAGAGEPVRALGLEEVPDDLEGAEGALALVGVEPGVVESEEERAQRRRRAAEHLRGVV